MLSTVIDKQVKQVVKNFPTYLGDCLIVNNCTVNLTYKILRIEAIVAKQVRYLDLIVDAETNQFLGLGQASDKKYDFSISGNICKSYSLAAYMKEAF
jgi:hypothetical protein